MTPVADGEDFSGMGRVFFSPHDAVADASLGAMNVDKLVDVHTESDVGFSVLQGKLVRNFQVRKTLGNVHWLRSCNGIVFSGQEGQQEALALESSGASAADGIVLE
jgi:hypothetical protein